MKMYSLAQNVYKNELLEMEFGSKFPEEFADLKVLKIRPKEGNIMIEGCFDSFVVLDFKGIGYGNNKGKPKKIILSWGEQELYGEETLWAE